MYEKVARVSYEELVLWILFSKHLTFKASSGSFLYIFHVFSKQDKHRVLDRFRVKGEFKRVWPFESTIQYSVAKVQSPLHSVYCFLFLWAERKCTDIDSTISSCAILSLAGLHDAASSVACDG